MVDQRIRRPRCRRRKRGDGAADIQARARCVHQRQPDPVAEYHVGDLRRACRSAGRRQVEAFLEPESGAPQKSVGGAGGRVAVKAVPGFGPGHLQRTADRDKPCSGIAFGNQFPQWIVRAGRGKSGIDERHLRLRTIDDRDQLGFAKPGRRQNDANARFFASEPDQKLLDPVGQVYHRHIGAHDPELQQAERHTVGSNFHFAPVQPLPPVHDGRKVRNFVRVAVARVRVGLIAGPVGEGVYSPSQAPPHLVRNGITHWGTSAGVYGPSAATENHTERATSNASAMPSIAWSICLASPMTRRLGAPMRSHSIASSFAV